jgi:hypothetical protein
MHDHHDKLARKGQTNHELALTGLHAGVLFVDDVNPATTTNHTAVFVAHLG